MEKSKISMLLFVFLFLAYSVLADKINSTSYKQTVIVSTGGKDLSSASYKTNLAIGIINGVVSSSSYINRLGFFHILLLADGQPCTSADQCEGHFCCSSSCSSSACPSGGGGGGGGAAAAGAGGSSNITTQAANNFTVSPDSIQEKVTLGASVTRTITIKNTGNTFLIFNLSIATVNDFISLSESSFVLAPGQEKIIDANITGKTFGSYLGEIQVTAGNITKSISVVIDVVSQQVLFDVKIDIPLAYKEVEAGGELKAQITLLNIGPPRKVDVTPTYMIKDKQGRVIYEASEKFSVEKQTSYVKSFNIPKDLQPGDYLAIVELRYANSFAASSELFKVVQKEAAIQKAAKSSVVLTSVLFILAGLLFLFAYLVISRIRFSERKELDKCYNIINEAENAINNNDIFKARQMYSQARNIYSGLENEDKKEVYGKLIELYNRLIKLR